MLLLEGAQVEGGERWLIEVSDVVEEDGRGGGGGDGDDAAGWVEGGEVRGCEVEACLRVFGLEVPEPDGVVQGTGNEFVFAGVYGQGGDWLGVAGEVVEEFGFVGVEVTDTVVGFGRCVDDVGGVVGEAGEVGTVFFGRDPFHEFALFGVEELEAVVGRGCDEELASVIEVEGGY